MRFVFQVPKKYSTKLSWTWNLKFPSITYYVFSREFQISSSGWVFGIIFFADLEVWKTNLTFWKKAHLRHFSIVFKTKQLRNVLWHILVLDFEIQKPSLCLGLYLGVLLRRFLVTSSELFTSWVDGLFVSNIFDRASITGRNWFLWSAVIRFLVFSGTNPKIK